MAFDLSAYAGQQVEVSITYVTDPGTGGVGAFVDDTKVVDRRRHDASGRLRGRHEHLDRPAARPRAARRTSATG